jgi:hypothetical protein
MLTSKKNISYLLFTVSIGYILSPWFFEKKLLFNELLAFSGLAILFYRRFRVSYDLITLCIVFLLLWSLVHLIFSVFRMDSIYFYLRNTVVSYSIFTYFIGFYCLPYLPDFIHRIRTALRWYVSLFLFIPLPGLLFERFGTAMIFPALFKKPIHNWVPPLLIAINLIYGVTYSSLTAWILAAFYFLLFISMGYRFFKQFILLMGLAFTVTFILLLPDLGLIANRFSLTDQVGVYDVIHSNPLLSLDPNSTWRLILWKQVLVDHFPANLFGIGFGTPMFKYFPIEDFSKIQSLPYVLGAHNSYVYLFGRLGLPYFLLIVAIYIRVFKEYFYYKAYYYENKQILIFWSFFAATIIALFNPALESPVYAGAYWLLLGFTARAIVNRNYLLKRLMA